MTIQSPRRAGVRRIGVAIVASLLLAGLLPAGVPVAAAPVGPATQLVFGVQPSNATAGVAISPAVTVQVQDASGNLVTTDTSNVTVAIGTNPGSGALSGTLTQAAVGGVATFNNLSINNAGIGYTLRATDGSLTPATSTSFTIIGPAAKLAFGVQPSNTVFGVAISPAVTVQVQDAAGSVVPSTASVTVAIGTNPGSGALSGTLTQAAVGGVATFNNLSINNAGIGYTLTAASSGLTGTTSTSFTIIGPAAKLAFGVQPSNTVFGVAISPAVTVQVQDANGFVVTSSTASVTVAIGTNPGSGALSGTLTQAAVGGVATFNNLSINNAGIGYTLTAASSGLTGTTSTSFTIIGPAAKLAFGVQPSNTVFGVAISPAVTVQVQDANGFVVTSSTASVTVAIGTNPGSGALSGTLTQAAVGGVATFNNLSINNAGIGYTLTAASSGLTGTTSTSFTIIGPAAKLAFGVQPSNTVFGVAISPAVTVQVQDANGFVVTSSTASVTVAIGTNPGSGALSGTLTQAAVGGVATFNNLSINNAGIGYTLTAASSGLTGTTSTSFTITGANRLAFNVQPGGGAAGAVWTQQPVVRVLDSLSQVVTTDSSTFVTLAIGTNPAGGTLTCTSGTTLRVTNGVATFSGCSINVASSSPYTLVATSSASYASATSSSFYIGANRLAFNVQPGGGAAGAVWTQQPVVRVLDSLSQVVTTDSSTFVTLAIGTNPAGGTLTCTSGTTLRVTNGVATFSGCSINVASSSPYTLVATSSASYASATSSSFYVTGTRPSLTITAASAPGNKPATGYTTKTPKTVKVGTYVTWRFGGGSTLAGQRVNVLVARKVNGVWGSPVYYKSLWADQYGIVRFPYKSASATAINVRVQWPGNSSWAVSTSKALGAYWK